MKRKLMTLLLALLATTGAWAQTWTMNPKEAEMALAQMSKIAKRMLLEGCTVKLGDWATIHVTLTAKAMEKRVRNSQASGEGSGSGNDGNDEGVTE